MSDTTDAPKRGRKPTPAPLRREQCNCRLPHWIVEWMERQPQGAGELIEHALITAYHLTPPQSEQ